MRGQATSSWFARLRRDRRLFALLALFLMIGHSVQPLAVAQASSNGHLVICTMLGAEPLPDGTPIHHDDCGECVLGASGLKAMAKAVLASAPAWEPIPTIAIVLFPIEDDRTLFSLPPERPPGIRAPPLSA